MALRALALALVTVLAVGFVHTRAANLCDIPPNVSYEAFVIVTNQTQVTYELSCAQSALLYPFGNGIRISCSEGSWWLESSAQYGDNSRPSLHLNEISCAQGCPYPSINYGHFRFIADELRSAGSDSPIRDTQSGRLLPGVKLEFYCYDDFRLVGENTTVCQMSGEWSPSFPDCADRKYFSQDKRADEETPFSNSKIIITVVVSVAVFLVLLVIMVLFALKARWRVICRKNRLPPSHPDDLDYPTGYTQLGSGPSLPSYAESTRGDSPQTRDRHHIGSMYRPTTTSPDYRQSSALESRIHPDPCSLSTRTHHSDIGVTHERHAGDTISEIMLLQGDGLSMSDTSTLVTVNTFESHTASNPSLSNSRRGVAGSVDGDGDVMDSTPLILGAYAEEEDDNEVALPNTEA